MSCLSRFNLTAALHGALGCVDFISVRIAEEDIPNMHLILEKITPQEVLEPHRPLFGPKSLERIASYEQQP